MIAAAALAVGVVLSAGAADGRRAGAATAPPPAATAPPPAATAPPPAAAASIQVVASGLDQPKKLSMAPGGAVILALAGDGAAPQTCTNGDQASCLDRSGAIDRISAGGRVQRLLTGLSSASSGSSAGVATGPAQARMVGGRLQVLFGDYAIAANAGREPYGAGGALLGDLVRFSAAGRSRHIDASLGPFEAAHNPDHGAGTDVARHVEPGIDSNPYSFVPYHGGYAVADAGGGDLLFVSRTGKVSLLAVFPTITETAPPGSFGSSQTRTISAQAQAVPDSVAVGPDGALYVGELGGEPYEVGKSSVYRVVPGHVPTVYARGLTSIGDIAFDRAGRLLVLEIDRRGLNDPALKGSGPPSPGAIVRVSANGTHSIVASTGLEFPTGMAVAGDGTVYVSNHGISSAAAGGGGELVRVSLR